MAETSWFWGGLVTGDASLAPYSDGEFSDLYSIMFTSDPATQGVIFGYLNELIASGTVSPVAINTGAGIVDGKLYINSTSVNVTIPMPSLSTRIDRIVLRKNFAAQTVRITLISGVEGGSEPALVQTPNTTWDIPLCAVSISTLGAITLTDERVYCQNKLMFGVMDNGLINGGFDIAQRQTPGTLTTLTQDKYSADRWRISRENADLQYQRNDGLGETGLTSKWYGTFKKITNTGKFMVYQILEGANSVSRRGKTHTFQIRMKASSAKTIRMAVIELQTAGTIDTIPATFVAAWNADTVDPTLGANLAIVGSVASKSVTTAWQLFSVTVRIPDTSKNIVCAVWTDSQFAANDILNLAQADIHLGSIVQSWVGRHTQQTIAMCQRFYAKTFSIDVAPAQSVGLVGAFRYIAGKAGAATEHAHWQFPVTMRITPTTITTYNPSAGNAQVRDSTAGADCSATATSNSSELGLDISATGNAGTAVGNALDVHLTVEAEL
jgi:hypothetical protein